MTYLEYPTYNRMVWLYDASIDYLSGKHIPLFRVAVLVFLFLFLPYTFLLLFGQWLQVLSHLRLFSWVNSARLKPFIDSYNAPYKAKHRYWPGLLLVLRFSLLLVSAFNFQEDPKTTLLAILILVAVDQWWSLHKQVCKYSGRFISSQPDYFNCNHLLCRSLQRKLSYSRVHLDYLCLDSICYIHWDTCLPANKCYLHHSIP